MWGEADASYPTLTPPPSHQGTREVWEGEGTVEFHQATWEDLPTQFTIVNTFQALEKNLAWGLGLKLHDMTYRMGRSLQFDPEVEKFVDDDELEPEAKRWGVPPPLAIMPC